MKGRAAVVGLGLIGGSVAGGLRQCGYRVSGYDPTPGRAWIAADLGLVDEPAAAMQDSVQGADVVVMAAPVVSILEGLEAVDEAAPDGALLIDMGSVKGPIVDGMSRLPGAARAVGGHPLAGDERSGPRAADPELLRGKAVVLCPSAKTDPDALRLAEALCHDLGATPLVVDAEEHDRILARTSHMPQFISTALALCLQGADITLSGSGVRDMTRLAASNPHMWRDIAATNRDHILDALGAFTGQLNDIMGMIADGDGAAIEDAVRRGGRVAREFRKEAAV